MTTGNLLARHFSSITSSLVAKSAGKWSSTFSNFFISGSILVGYNWDTEYPPDATYANADSRMVFTVRQFFNRWEYLFFPANILVALPCAA